MTTRRLATSTLVLSVLVAAGCRDREITTYRAPKEKPPAMPAASSAPQSGSLPPDHPPIGGVATAPGPDMASTAVPTASGNALTWTAPANWAPKALGSMRKGSFTVKGDGGEADLSITAFPGATGGLEANLNRWRGQLGLAPTPDVLTAVENISANGLQFTIVDYANNGTRLLGAVVPFDGNSWFFKLTGPDALVASQKVTYLEFLRTVKENK